jgi:threonine synthase
MDILISSNLERLIYRIAGDDSAVNAELMASLSKNGKYTITEEMAERLGDFYGNYANEDETAAQIKSVYESDGYVMDTHTAVASAVYEKYKAETGDTTKTLIASTASPYKFARSVMSAIDSKYENGEDFVLIDELCRISGVKIPAAVEEIRSAAVLHNTVVDRDEMKQTVLEFLGL